MSLLNKLTPFLRQRKLIEEAVKVEVDVAIKNWESAGAVDVNTLGQPEDLPSFQLYGAVQKAISCFGEQVLDHPSLIKQNNEIAAIDEEYMPSYPPRAPLTGSFANNLYFLDFPLNRQGETVANLFLKYQPLPKRPQVLAQAVQYLSESRCGFYEIKQVNGHLLTVQELHSEELFDAVCASNYKGQVGEIWLCRFIPSLHESEEFEITISTPYVLRGHTRKEYESFLKRQRLRTKNEDEETLLTRVFKRPRDFEYWPEFIFQGYLTHSNVHIELLGIPDRPGTKQHEENGRSYRV